MNVLRGWAKAGAVVAAVGTLLVVQVANADRPQSSVSEQKSSTELVVAAPTKSATTLAAHAVHGATSQSVTADTAALAAGAMFYAISPYRSFDTRQYTDGRLSPGFGFYIVVSTDANGAKKIPDNAVAVTYNLTITRTAGSYGYLSVIPCGQPWSGNSSINWWTSGLDLANGGVVALGVDPTDGSLGCIDVDLGDVPGTTTDFIIDITGYYAP